MADNTLFYTVVVTSVTEEVPGVKTFTIAREDGSDIPYQSGQFITFVFTHHGREDRRSYSISTSPGTGDQLAFTVKRVDNGAYSRYLVDRVKPGDKQVTTGAAGLFTLAHAPGNIEQVFFFVAGIGITPVISMIRSILISQPSKKAVLVYSNRIKEDTVFYKELLVLQQSHPGRLEIEWLFSTSFNLARARLNKALVRQLIDEYAQVDKQSMVFYLCGPFTYMRMVTYALEEYGVDNAHIIKENFNTNDRNVLRAEPPDKETHTVTIRLRGQLHSLQVRYPETILQAAKRHGLQLPYSCEVGRCGSCAARCTSGKVWLFYNEVLMDMDLAHGSILTCTGHPVGGDVVIEV